MCPLVQDLGSWRADSSQADEALHKLDAAGINKARGAAQAALDALMLTDAPLMYSPSLIALAALRAGFRKVWYSCCSLHAFCFPCEHTHQWWTLCCMQIEVSSGKYIAHVASKQQEVAASQDMKNAAPPHEQLMSQLSELDKLGQEGAAPVDDAEVSFC